MTKDKLPTVDIKGKEYVMVKDRISYFNETYPTGSIRTELVSQTWGKWIVKATVIPQAAHPESYYTGYSQADEASSMINKQAGLENAETSAVGRALAMMGIGVIDSVASADEMNKAGAVQTTSAYRPAAKPKIPDGMDLADAAAIDDVMAHPSNGIENAVKCTICGEATEYRTGTNKNGKPYKGYFCVTQQKGHVEWIN